MRLKQALLCVCLTAAPCCVLALEDLDDLIARCAPSVSADTVKAIVKTESGFNPLAIGVVGGSVRQPQNLQEAVFTVTQLVTQQKSFSVGLGQINSANFEALGVTAEELFEPCANLKAMSSILTQCYAKQQGKGQAQALGDALSCYYSGNEKTGYEHGYVDKVAANAPPVVPSVSILSQGAKSQGQDKQEPVTALIVSPSGQGNNLIF